MKYNYENLVKFFNSINLYKTDYFNSINNKKIMLPNKKGNMIYFGVFPKLDKENNIINYTICVPEINDLNSFLINIHEYTHAIDLENNMNSKYKVDEYVEVMPNILERLYIILNEPIDIEYWFNNKKLEDYYLTTSYKHKKGIYMSFEGANKYLDNRELIYIDNPINIEEMDNNIKKKVYQNISSNSATVKTEE